MNTNPNNKSLVRPDPDPSTEPPKAISDALKCSLEAAGESAARCRIVSYMLVTASVLAFMAFLELGEMGLGDKATGAAYSGG